MKMTLSVVIPAHNEEGSIKDMVESVAYALTKEHIPFEIVVVNDHSTDTTMIILAELVQRIPQLRSVNNEQLPGYGRAVVTGINVTHGTYVAVMMADLSDDPEDLVRFYRAAQKTGVDCVFGSRFIQGGVTYNYPKLKLILNRFANTLVRLLFHIRYNDCTNAFKLYKRETLDGLRPFLSPHFNLTLELPLKAIVRGYTYTVLPNSWHNRKSGVSKLKIKEMGSRYLFVLLYCLIERYFSRGDFKKQHAVANIEI
jgi:dolichol-phosphate mannosyltransferase